MLEYEIYISRASEVLGVPRTREIYEQAISSGLPDKDVKTMCLKYAELEKSLGEIGITDAAKDKLKEAGITEDDMASLEKQWAPLISDATNEANRRVGFVRAGVVPEAEGGMRSVVNNDDIELPEESDSELEEETVEIAQKDVPSAVFGDLVRKRELEEQQEGGGNGNGKEKEGDNRLGALERIKRLKRAAS